MRLLEMQRDSTPVVSDKQPHSVSGKLDPANPASESSNVETKNEKISMTIAVDLVIRGIREPVRFVIETSVKILPRNGRFWCFNKRSLVQQFFLHSKESTSLTSIEALTRKEDLESDEDEPMLSGTGEVSKSFSADELASWEEVLDTWQVNEQRPKLRIKLVRQGITEALRGEAWQRLRNFDSTQELMNKYRMLITKESSCESVIPRDVNGTFPAHDFFKKTRSEAYAVYEGEIGYCQGLRFLVASLLLHMPGEQTFCVLVRLMNNYGLRDLYKDRFDNLRMRVYRLNCLMEDQLPDLYKHFCHLRIETHMLAAQWFLTLFTASCACSIDVLQKRVAAARFREYSRILQSAFTQEMS
ncbi:hypothetical protein QAD02_013168 [Eretmocerus hayati]|uniref:Uncharacterized protein n=1 Tax=Eretmocerus hayati TaxID=131215 RepID=A0ACC2P3I4_9HYME|nr:hypothetical protein QAD02_013168 [Eretmocerus hayati]